MTISLCIIAYNEENTIDKLLEDILQQDYSRDQIEIILVDSMSTDETKQKMNQFKENYQNEFLDIKVISNSGKILPCGWNEALLNFTTEVILRIDAHASIRPDFVSKNVADLQSGEDIVGGYRPNIIDDNTPLKQVLLMGESSMFGSSIASYRRQGEKAYVNSLFHAAYKRTVFQKVGGYNEHLARTEDNEMHYRMRKAGFKLCYNPEIISYQHTRPTLKGILKQKYANGYWIGLTVGVCPGCISIFHFVPFVFLMGILLTSILCIFKLPLLAILMWGAYWLIAILMAASSVIPEKKHPVQLFLPVLFFFLHISYGIGTILGLLKMPLWRRKHRESPRVREVKGLLNHE